MLGLPFDVPPPYIPVDEEYPARPESVYSLVKHLEEQMAIELVRWHPELSITALRFSNVMEPEDYAEFPSFDADARLRKWNLWGYIDARDGAQAVERALAKSRPGLRPLHHRRGRHRDVAPERRARRRGLPRRAVRGELGEQRHAALDRQGAPPARLRAAPLLARRGDGCRGIRSPELTDGATATPGPPLNDGRPRSRELTGAS